MYLIPVSLQNLNGPLEFYFREKKSLAAVRHLLQCLMVYHLICIIAHFEPPLDSENPKTKEHGSK